MILLRELEMTKQIKETMMKTLGMNEADDEKDFNDSNFGNMAEVIMALCASSFILSQDAKVSPANVEEILINSLERGSKEKIYNLSGKNNIFDIKGASEERRKADNTRQENAAILKAIEKVTSNKNSDSLKWGTPSKSFMSELKKWKFVVNGKNVIVFGFTAPPKKTIWVDGDWLVLTNKETIQFFNEKINEYMPGMLGGENGEPIKIGYFYVKYKVVDDQELSKFINESESHEMDDGFIPKLVISTNHNVIPTIQNIVMSKSGEKYDELLNMMDTIVEYFIEGENDITKIRQMYQQNTEKNIPSYLIIRMMGGEGQTGGGKGTVKGDIRISLRNESGNEISTIFSMKYGNTVVHKFTSEDVLVNGITDVYKVAGLDRANKNLTDWKETVQTYSGKGIERIVGIFKREPIINQKQVQPFYGRLDHMGEINRARMLFGFLERFAMGSDKASILRTDKNGKKWHTIPSLISDYFRYQDQYVEVQRNDGKNIKFCIKDENKLYGILKISKTVDMDGELEEFVDKVKKVFTQPRTDMWTLISYCNFMERIIEDYSTEKPITKLLAERVAGMASHTLDISKKFDKTVKSSYKALLSNLDSDEFKKSDILKFMNGELDSIDPNDINSYITVMVDKISNLYNTIKSIPVKK